MQTKKNQDLSDLQLAVNIKFPSYLENNALVKKYISDKNNHENYIENLFRNVILIERYARNKIVINIEVLEINCDLIPYAILGASLALNEANIEQKGICTAANVIRKNNEMIIDPTFDEEANCDFKLLWGCLYDLDENTLYVQKGAVDDESLKNVLLLFFCLLKLILFYFIKFFFNFLNYRRLGPRLKFVKIIIDISYLTS